jgi:hypothetical protein
MNDQVKISLVAFNFAVMIYMLYRIFTREAPWSGGAVVGAAAIALLIGAVVGGIAYVVSLKMNG